MTRYTVEFSVDFLQGKQRPRFGGGRAYTPKETKDAELRIGTAYKGASIRRYGRVVKAPQGVPVAVMVECYKPEPKAFPSYIPKWLRPRIPFVVKGDSDNYLKIIDGLNSIAWDDDAQVTAAHVFKRDRNGVMSERMDFTVQFDLEEEY